VVANGCLRRALETLAEEKGAELFIPPLRLCTDNAAMAALAVEKWRRGEFSTLDLDAVATVG
jgi:N6-L-threonylcarbamoyladenine synthase